MFSLRSQSEPGWWMCVSEMTHAIFIRSHNSHNIAINSLHTHRAMRPGKKTSADQIMRIDETVANLRSKWNFLYTILMMKMPIRNVKFLRIIDRKIGSLIKSSICVWLLSVFSVLIFRIRSIEIPAFAINAHKGIRFNRFVFHVCHSLFLFFLNSPCFFRVILSHFVH